MKSNFIILSLFILFTIQYAHSFMFEVRPGPDEKCIIEEFRADTLVNGDYEVSDKITKNLAYPSELVMNSMSMRFSIRDPRTGLLFDKNDAKKGSFSFTAQEAGEYFFCFQDSYIPGAPIMPLGRTVSLNMKTGIEANDFSDVVTKGQLQPSEVELKKIEEVVDKIKEEILYMRGREETMRNTNESTNARVAWLTALCLFVLIGTAGFQITYLKRYFKQRKLI
ncbi:emp24/gp25L/p24 family protein [Tieghemostelium lacteum]|uniref:Emp24/gp25L/p24 family protein n=1 Tax=Tieghemostelium lacteum TaxID=361077 RepID=A0A151ZAF7_TIELA|nr:emp24/gp25L/p24 family protein [Tieghemostelium lacteum]|eukprot:KYQ90923.1 emp24/gp25L/p24 family protein [Tieghemostelium lacteum]